METQATNCDGKAEEKSCYSIGKDGEARLGSRSEDIGKELGDWAGDREANG